MKILMVDAAYDEFLDSVYADIPGLADQAYQPQKQAILNRCFGAADYYSHALTAIGHPTADVIWNAIPLQLKWARENAPDLAQACASMDRDVWRQAVLKEMVTQEKPDVLYLQTIYDVPAPLLHELKPLVGLIAGQRAAPIPKQYDHSPLDIVFSSLPNMVDEFQSMGVTAAFIPLAFDQRVLDHLIPRPKRHDVTFVGGLGPDHASRNATLEAVAREIDMTVWGYGENQLAPNSPLRHAYQGQAWGLDLYRIFQESRVVLNVHSPWAEGFANNLRLFEATGVGTCMVTDRKHNLPDFFEENVEVMAYDTPQECIAVIQDLLCNAPKRETIAKAGQARTLKQHTYAALAERTAALLDEQLTS